jgi:hypothetical protein
VKYKNVYLFKKSAQALLSILPGILISLLKGRFDSSAAEKFCCISEEGFLLGRSLYKSIKMIWSTDENKLKQGE